MSEGTPSLTALLGLLAIAGYQNRDKISEWLGGGQHPAPAGTSVPQTGAPQDYGQAAPQPGGFGGFGSQQAGGLGGLLGGLPSGQDVGSFLGSGINELMNRFKQSGQGPVADSWVNHGPNQPIGPNQMEQAIGPEMLQSLAQQTGLSREELLARLSRELPQAVDHYTPDGRIPGRF